MKKKKINRRDFLKGSTLVLASDPFISFMQAWFNKSSYAVGETVGSKCYVYFQHDFAPPRWMYDVFLNPLNQGNFLHNPCTGTIYSTSANRYVAPRYHVVPITVNGATYHLPPLWRVDLPAPGSGQTRKMTQLLKNLIQIRGINTQNASHTFCQRLHMQPLGAQQSVTALPADYGSAPIAAVNIDAKQYAFASLRGHFPVTLRAGNAIADLVSPFKSDANAVHKQLLSGSSSEIRQLFLNIDRQIAGAAQFDALSSSALNLIDSNIGDMEVVWNRLVNKYQNLINRAIRQTVYPGVNDKYIGVTGARDARYRSNLQIVNGDLREMIGPNSDIPLLAESFAATEFIVTENRSRSLAVNIGSLSNLNFAVNKHFRDEHNTGSMPSLLLNTISYGAFGACLLELIAVLKNRGLYNDTVIDVASEFNREPRKNQFGSDHGSEGASVCLYSGQITGGPFIIGDITRDDSDATRGATWGRGANNGLSVGHFASTLATLLGTPSPVTAFPSLIKVENGNVTLNNGVQRGRIVS